METIKVKYFTTMEPLVKNGDWVDLRCAEDIVMFKGDYRQIPLGVAVQLPKGYEAIIAPRSSTFKNFGIIAVNSIGIIDEDYCGPNDQWHFPALATRYTKISKGDRICQFRLLWHMQDLNIQTVEDLSGPDRGGFGSTGVK